MIAKQHPRRLLPPILAVVASALVPAGFFLFKLGAATAVTSPRQQTQSTAVTMRSTGPDLSPGVSAESRSRLQTLYAKSPLVFEANLGQTDPQVKFLARGSGYTLFLTASGAVLSLGHARQLPTERPSTPAFAKVRECRDGRSRSGPASVGVLGMQMAGAKPNPEITGGEIQPGVSNYFSGSDPGKWRTNVPQYARVRYREVYPGVDLIFRGEQQHLAFDFILAPGADAALINLHFTGTKAEVGDSGSLVLSSAVGDLTLRKPVAYQEKNGARRLVDARFVVKDEGHAGFAIGDYDRNAELVIDPTLVYSTYIGGAGEDAGFGIGVDSLGNAYLTGKTNSTPFPGSSGTLAGGFDAFVTKVIADGAAILYSTFLGGSSDDSGTAIAVDSSSNVYVAGATSSPDFPVTSGAAQTGFGGVQDGFVAKLNPTGAVLYATFIGGSGSDSANAIAVDASGNAYISGGEQSSNFPTTPGAFQTTTSDGLDAFVAKLNPAGSAFLYSTYLGGSSYDIANGIALVPGCVSDCNAYVAGTTTSSDFPLQNAFDANFALGEAFVTQLNSSGSALVYSTFLGGDNVDAGLAIAVDSSGAAYVSGYTLSDDFPVVNAFQPQLQGATDTFVAKFSPDGSQLSYSSYLGGGEEKGQSIAVDSHSNAYLIGTSSTAFLPLADPIQSKLQGNSDAFVAMINPTGATLVYSTYLGGSGDESYGSIALDASGAAYVTGRTTSSKGFPTASPLQGAYGGGAADAYLAKIAPAPVTAEASVGVFPTTQLVTTGATTSPVQVTVTPLNGFSGSVTLACSSLPANAVCSFNPPSVASSGTSMLTVATKVPPTQLAGPAYRRATLLYALLLPISALAVLGTGVVKIGRRGRRRMSLALCLLFLFGLIFLAACSAGNGGGAGGPGPINTTLPGTYSITVTGTSDTDSHSAVLVLQVIQQGPLPPSADAVEPNRANPVTQREMRSNSGSSAPALLEQAKLVEPIVSCTR